MTRTQVGTRLDELFASLLARAFTGELTAAYREANREQLARGAAERDLRLTGTRPIAITETATATATSKASGEDVFTSHPRHALLDALSGRQRELFQVVSTDEEYVTPETPPSDGVTVDLARRGLELLAAMGLVARVDVLTPGAGGKPQFARAYRGLRTRDETWLGDDARLEDLAALGGGPA